MGVAGRAWLGHRQRLATARVRDQHHLPAADRPSCMPVVHSPTFLVASVAFERGGSRAAGNENELKAPPSHTGATRPTKL